MKRAAPQTIRIVLQTTGEQSISTGLPPQVEKTPRKAKF